MSSFFLQRLDEARRLRCLELSKPRHRASCSPSSDPSALEWYGHHQSTDISWVDVPEFCICHPTEFSQGPPTQGTPPLILHMKKWNFSRTSSKSVTSEWPRQKLEDRSSNPNSTTDSSFDHRQILPLLWASFPTCKNKEAGLHLL